MELESSSTLLLKEWRLPASVPLSFRGFAFFGAGVAAAEKGGGAEEIANIIRDSRIRIFVDGYVQEQTADDMTPREAFPLQKHPSGWFGADCNYA